MNYIGSEKVADFLVSSRKKHLFCRKISKIMKKIRLLDKFAMTVKFLRGEISLVMDVAIDAEGKESVVRDGQYWEFSDGERVHCRFSEGDVVAVMMSYHDAGLDQSVFGETPGWTKKMCVNEKYMPYKMVIDKVRCVRAQDLTEEEALRAGLHRNPAGYYMAGGDCGGTCKDWKEMFRNLFNRMFKVMYHENPWVIVYDVTPVIANPEIALDRIFGGLKARKEKLAHDL